MEFRAEKCYYVYTWVENAWEISYAVDNRIADGFTEALNAAREFGRAGLAWKVSHLNGPVLACYNPSRLPLFSAI